MRAQKRAQSSIEYLIMAGFIILIVIGILAAGLFYSSQLKDRIKLNQLNNAIQKIVQSAESVFYAGEPSRITIQIYLPAGIRSFTIQNKDITIQIETSSGLNTISYNSNVLLEGAIPITEGVKKIRLQAQPSKVLITA